MNAESKFLEKLNQRRSGGNKAASPTDRSEATRPKAETQQRLFDSATEPTPTADEIMYQRTCDELPPEWSQRLQQLTAKG